ncbi:hypothetical protein DWB61_02040 [Ancylomarina euxinus]|uniref:Uncharacterized protein n=1 Tax=Ancylomarina euxinus TaxID=2283627 RepID=A0A425Y902_9BACT|nr:hypothetical protein [Ancylomarina euxinus]MCZ4693311.1 hypothetical protein [Ancylomarina euxinus]MUP13539.1 hypothetical protein [Ancylomarina euxinus]RRG24812.1 hypothetical protein DWB61_02040 [Ancylomarina euxinus]
MTVQFSQTETDILDQFTAGTSFTLDSKNYTVLESGKPRPPKGEGKTDLYILANDSNNNSIELKISIKQHNADFLENKISLDRAIQILGDDAQDIISDSISDIEDEFRDDYLITINKYGRTVAKTLKIGWKFELLNCKSGAKSGLMKLNDAQKIDVYSGSNLDCSKKNSNVNGRIVANSGVANCILELKKNPTLTTQTIINDLRPIADYAKTQSIYFACKAVNYRMTPDKWDGNRPLAVYVNWFIDDSKLNGEIVFDSPLSTSANSIGKNIRKLLKILNINDGNFKSIKTILENVKYYE